MAKKVIKKIYFFIFSQNPNSLYCYAAKDLSKLAIVSKKTLAAACETPSCCIASLSLPPSSRSLPLLKRKQKTYPWGFGTRAKSNWCLSAPKARVYFILQLSWRMHHCLLYCPFFF
jgi:hypothetical protein